MKTISDEKADTNASRFTVKLRANLSQLVEDGTMKKKYRQIRKDVLDLIRFYDAWFLPEEKVYFSKEINCGKTPNP